MNIENIMPTDAQQAAKDLIDRVNSFIASATNPDSANNAITVNSLYNDNGSIVNSVLASGKTVDKLDKGSKVPDRFLGRDTFYIVSNEQYQQLEDMVLAGIDYKELSSEELFEVIVSYLRPALYQHCNSQELYRTLSETKKLKENNGVVYVNGVTWPKHDYANILYNNISDKRFFLPTIIEYNRHAPVSVITSDKNHVAISQSIQKGSELYKECKRYFASDLGFPLGFEVSDFNYNSLKSYSSQAEVDTTVEDYIALDNFVRKNLFNINTLF